MTAQNSSGFDWPARSANRIWLGVCGGLADKWNVNAWLVRITFFLFVVPLGYVYYLGAQNMPDPTAREPLPTSPNTPEHLDPSGSPVRHEPAPDPGVKQPIPTTSTH